MEEALKGLEGPKMSIFHPGLHVHWQPHPGCGQKWSSYCPLWCCILLEVPFFFLLWLRSGSRTHLSEESRSHLLESHIFGNKLFEASGIREREVESRRQERRRERPPAQGQRLGAMCNRAEKWSAESWVGGWATSGLSCHQRWKNWGRGSQPLA